MRSFDMKRGNPSVEKRLREREGWLDTQVVRLQRIDPPPFYTVWFNQNRFVPCINRGPARYPDAQKDGRSRRVDFKICTRASLFGFPGVSFNLGATRRFYKSCRDDKIWELFSSRLMKKNRGRKVVYIIAAHAPFHPRLQYVDWWNHDEVMKKLQPCVSMTTSVARTSSEIWKK